MNQTKEKLLEDFRIQTIQEAALRVIAKKGASATTMQDVAAEAGVAKGTLYLYFQNREQLFGMIAERSLTTLSAQLNAAIESETQFEARLRASITTAIGFFDENRATFRVFVEDSQPALTGDGPTCRAKSTHYQNHITLLTRELEIAMKAGHIRSIDASRLSLFIIEGINGVITRRMIEPDPPAVSDDVDWIMQTILEGISNKRSRA